MDDASTPPPGWYPDGSGQLRWWDGVAWGPPAPGPQWMPAPYAAAPDRSLAVIAHVSSIFAGFLGPLLVFLIAKDRDPFARHHAAEALNFSITLLVAYVVSIVLVLVLIGIVLLAVVWVGSIVLHVIAAVAANRGEWYRYPVNLHIVT